MTLKIGLNILAISGSKFFIRNIFILSFSFVFLHACASSYEKYMSEGDEARKQSLFEKASQSYHLAYAEIQKDAKKKVTETIRLKQFDTLQKEAESCELAKNPIAALKAYQESYDLSQSSSNPDAERGAQYLLAMSRVYLNNSEPTSASENYKLALNILESAGKSNSHYASDALNGLAQLEMDSGKYKQALQNFKKSVLILESLGNSHLLSMTLHQMAACYGQMSMENEQITTDELAKQVEIQGIRGSIRKMLP